MPRFSIVTCTRNSMATIEQTLSSVQLQSFKDFEHVFVDGNSSDGTLDRIRQLRGNVKVVEDVGGGISHAMNVGIQNATGEIIVHLHSDDYFAHSNVLQRVDLLFKNNSQSWLFGRILSDIDSALFETSYAVPRISYQRLLRGNFIPHPATFIKRSMFEQHGVFNTNLKYAMDYELWLRLAKLELPLQVDEVFTVFRRHEGGASTGNIDAARLEAMQVQRKSCNNIFDLAYLAADRIKMTMKVKMKI